MRAGFGSNSSATFINTCIPCNFIVKMIIEEWAAGKKNINIKKNKNFYESKLLSLNISKAKKELSWEPRLTLIETIKFTVDWYKHYLINNRGVRKVPHELVNVRIDTAATAGNDKGKTTLVNDVNLFPPSIQTASSNSLFIVS